MEFPFDPRYGAMQPRPNSDQPMGLYKALTGAVGQEMPIVDPGGVAPYQGPPQFMGVGQPLSPTELTTQKLNDNIFRQNAATAQNNITGRGASRNGPQPMKLFNPWDPAGTPDTSPLVRPVR